MTTSILVFAVSTLLVFQTPADSKTITERAIASIDQRFEEALQKRDRTEVESILADPFMWVHALGRVASRPVFIENSIRGLGLARQYTQSSTFERTLAVYGNTAIATARVRNRFPDGRRRCRRKTMRRVTGSNSPTSEVSASAARRRELRKNAFDDRREFVQVIGLADNL